MANQRGDDCSVRTALLDLRYRLRYCLHFEREYVHIDGGPRLWCVSERRVFQRRHPHSPKRLSESHKLFKGSRAAPDSDTVRHRLELLRDRVWESRQKYLPRPTPAKLGLLADQELPADGAAIRTFYGRHVQSVEPRQFRESCRDRRGNRALHAKRQRLPEQRAHPEQPLR